MPSNAAKMTAQTSLLDDYNGGYSSLIINIKFYVRVIEGALHLNLISRI